MGRLFAGFNLIGVGAITTLLFLNLKHTPYPFWVGLALVLLIGGALLFCAVIIPLYFWRSGRRESVRSRDYERS